MYKKIPTKIENTDMQEYYDSDGTLTAYKISPAIGFKLHINSRDEEVIDEMTGEKTGEVILGFTTSFIRVCHNYDFDENPLAIYALKDDAQEGGDK